MKNKYKIILLTVLVIVIGIVIYYTVSMRVPVDVINIKRADFINEIEQIGVIKSENSVDISSKIGGEVLFAIPENTKVNEGDLILEVDSSEFQIKIDELNAQKQSNEAQKKMNTPELYDSQISQLETAIAQSELEEKNAQVDYENGKILYENGAISKKDLDSLELRLNSIKNKLKSDRDSLNLLYETSKPKEGMNEFYDSNNEAIDENIKLLNKKIQDSHIYAPFSGLITRNSAKVGEIIQPMTPVISISGDGKLIVESMILTDDVVSIETGDDCEIVQKTSTGDLKGRATIFEVESFANDISSTLGVNEKRVKIKCEIVDMGDLKINDNYEVDLNIIVSKEENAIYVPKTAIFKMGENDALFVVENGRAKIREVVTGQENDTDIVIKEGLDENEKVIRVSDTVKLKNGSNIKEIKN